MLETLMNLVRQQSGDAIINNPAIPNDKNETAVQTVTDGILGGLQQQAQGGNVGGLLSSIMGGQSNNVTNAQNPLTGGIMNNVIGSLVSKLGVSQSVANSIAAAVVPMVLSRLFSKATDPNDSSVDVGSIMGHATGNQAAANVDWMSMASGAMADGKLDMNDLMRAAGGFMGGSGSSGQQQSGGGLGGMLGGLFGK